MQSYSWPVCVCMQPINAHRKFAYYVCRLCDVVFYIATDHHLHTKRPKTTQTMNEQRFLWIFFLTKSKWKGKSIRCICKCVWIIGIRRQETLTHSHRLERPIWSRYMQTKRSRLSVCKLSDFCWMNCVRLYACVRVYAYAAMRKTHASPYRCCAPQIEFSFRCAPLQVNWYKRKGWRETAAIETERERRGRKREETPECIYANYVYQFFTFFCHFSTFFVAFVVWCCRHYSPFLNTILMWRCHKIE